MMKGQTLKRLKVDMDMDLEVMVLIPMTYFKCSLPRVELVEVTVMEEVNSILTRFSELRDLIEVK